MAANTGLRTVGNADSSISPHLKVWIKQGGTQVVGVIGEGTTRDLQANWNSPFEQDSLGGRFEKAGGLIQESTGATSVTELSSRQVWQGNQPTTINLIVKFYALSDARQEVMEPLKALEMFAAPQVRSNPGEQFKAAASGENPAGRIPGQVSINIGRRTIFTGCVIGSISTPLDKEVDRSGNLIRAEVTLQIQTIDMTTRAQIPGTFG